MCDHFIMKLSSYQRECLVDIGMVIIDEWCFRQEPRVNTLHNRGRNGIFWKIRDIRLEYPHEGTPFENPWVCSRWDWLYLWYYLLLQLLIVQYQFCNHLHLPMLEILDPMEVSAPMKTGKHMKKKWDKESEEILESAWSFLLLLFTLVHTKILRFDTT